MCEFKGLWLHYCHISCCIAIAADCLLTVFHVICQVFKVHVNCDRILKSSSKSHMKSGVFLHVFNDISIYA